jgi:hypothetical protein
MGSPDEAAAYLRAVVSGRRFMADERSMEAEHLRQAKKDPLSTYAWMRVFSEAQRRSAESDALSRLSYLLEGKDQPDVDHK